MRHAYRFQSEGRCRKNHHDTFNLAAATVRDGGQPLLLDLDPQCHLSSILNAVPLDDSRSLFGFYQSARSLETLTQAGKASAA